MKQRKGNPNNNNKNSRNKQKAAFKVKQRQDAVRNLFNSFYMRQWGQRWSTLLQAMEEPTRYCCLLNRFAHPSSFTSFTDIPLATLDFLSIPCLVRLDDADIRPPDVPFPPPVSYKNISPYYLLDAASVLATEALDIRPDDNILDICAAPGGKSLAIIQKLLSPENLNLFFAGQNGNKLDFQQLLDWVEKNSVNSGVFTETSQNSVSPDITAIGQESNTIPENLVTPKNRPTLTGTLVCNDISPGRINRLKNVIHSFLPKNLRQNIVVTQKDATNPVAWNSESFTKILIDAPCSSERHLLQNVSEFEKWGTSRSRTNAVRQFLIFKNSLEFLKPNGKIVYVTCSVSFLENDGLIDKILKKSKFCLEVEKKKWKIGEETKYGWMVLPDRDEKWGPLYFCVLRKGEIKQKKSKREEKEDEEDEEDEEHSNEEGYESEEKS